MNANEKATDFKSEWQRALLLYPLYSALCREFVIDMPACADLETGREDPPLETVGESRQWFQQMDERIQVHQLRQFLQTTALTSEEGLRGLLQHHLGKAVRNDADRDKVDFLLVQFFAHSAPSRLEENDVDMEYTGHALDGLVGEVDAQVPTWLSPLEEIIQSANQCQSLNELLTSGILEKGRKLKHLSGDKYFEPVALVAFTRFNFLLRRVFFRLMHQDLNAILDGLRELETAGVSTLDCRSAQFSGDEPVARLRMICQSWKVMFHAEYSSGQPLRMLVDLRNVVDAALAKAPAAVKAKSGAPQALAAAAGAGSSNSSAVQEFEVNIAPAGMDSEGNGY